MQGGWSEGGVGAGGSSEGGWILDGFLKIKPKGSANKLDVDWEKGRVEKNDSKIFGTSNWEFVWSVCLGSAV